MEYERRLSSAAAQRRGRKRAAGTQARQRNDRAAGGRLATAEPAAGRGGQCPVRPRPQRRTGTAGGVRGVRPRLRGTPWTRGAPRPLVAGIRRAGARGASVDARPRASPGSSGARGRAAASAPQRLRRCDLAAAATHAPPAGRHGRAHPSARSTMIPAVPPEPDEELLETITRQIGTVVVGQERTVELMLTALACRGHVLLEGVPGVAKTLLARALAATLGVQVRRVQFTPDMLPSDLTGTMTLRGAELVLRRGPVFTNVLLADEINRTPPKTQAALLEAMQEGQVTIDGVS